MGWELWAHDYGKGFFMHIGPKRYVELHMIKDHPIVEVDVEEDPEGTYYGFIRTGKEVPVMIYPSKTLFDICFPYGLEVEERAGKGKIVKLKVTRR